MLTHALAVSASQFVHKNTSQRIYTSMHSAGLKLTKLTYCTRFEDNLIRHRGDRRKDKGWRLPLELSTVACTRVIMVVLINLCAETIISDFEGDWGKKYISLSSASFISPYQ